MKLYKIFFPLFISLIITGTTVSQWNPTSPIVETANANTFIKKGDYWFLGTSGTGVYRRTISDTTWIAVGNELTDNEIIFLGSNNNYVFAISRGNIFRSSNNGDEWSQLNFPEFYITSFFCSNDTLLVAGSNGIQASYNNGNNWVILNPSLSGVTDLKKVNNKIYAPRYDDIYISIDNGANWSLMYSFPLETFDGAFCALPGLILTVRFTPGTTGYNRIYYSTNDGATWDYSSFTIFAQLGNFFVDNGSIYIASGGTSNTGIFKSTNNGISWSLLNSGLPNNVSYKNLYAENNYIMTGSFYIGCYISSNAGNSWSEFNSGLSNIDIDKMYSLNDGLLVYVRGIGKYKTINEGANWTNFNFPFHNGREITILGRENNVFYGHGWILTFLKSNDFGVTWDSVSVLPFIPFADLMEAESDELYYAKQFAPGVYKSSNGGISWEDITANLTIIFTGDILKSNSDLFISTTLIDEGVYRFNNATSQWNPVNNGITELHIQLLEKLGSFIYAASYSKIFRSSDNGNNWIDITGILTGTINTIVSHNDILMVGTTTGFFFTNDYGDTWRSFNEGLTNTDVRVIEVYNNKVYIGLKGTGVSSSQGIWNISLSQLTNISNVSTEIPENFKLYNNYPNPFNPSTKIKFDIPNSSIVKLTIYNSLGQQVSVLVNKKLEAGIYEYTFSGYELSSGIYFYRLESGEFFETKKMMLIK